MANIAVIVESWPSHEDPESVGLDPEEDAPYGLYHGVSFPSVNSTTETPSLTGLSCTRTDREEDAADEDEIREIVQGDRRPRSRPLRGPLGRGDGGMGGGGWRE